VGNKKMDKGWVNDRGESFVDFLTKHKHYNNNDFKELQTILLNSYQAWEKYEEEEENYKFAYGTYIEEYESDVWYHAPDRQLKLQNQMLRYSHNQKERAFKEWVTTYKKFDDKLDSLVDKNPGQVQRPRFKTKTWFIYSIYTMLKK